MPVDQRFLESLHLPTELADRIHRHALRAYPAEACGFLLGTLVWEGGTLRGSKGAPGNKWDPGTVEGETGNMPAGGNGEPWTQPDPGISERKRRAPAGAWGNVIGLRAECNRAATNDRFLIDAADVFRAMQAARRGGSMLLGVYHSHPDGVDEPSATDRREAWGGWLHLIVATDGDEAGPMRCWIDAEGTWTQVPIIGDPGGAG